MPRPTARREALVLTQSLVRAASVPIGPGVV